jgi:hypothetical protein
LRFAAPLVVIVACLAGGAASQPPPIQNLKVLPKDIPRAQLTEIMQGFRMALGVECTHCHVSLQDRASDAKPTKLVARKMLQMTIAINTEHLKDAADPAAAPAAGAAAGAAAQKVTCYTCHRGALKPSTGPGGGM